jgi:hypothetical protein
MKKKNIISLLLLALLISLTFINRSFRINREKMIRNSGMPVIGEVYTFSDYSRGGSNIKYKYQLDKIYYSKIGKPIPNSLKEGDKFLVLYLESDPRKSILLLDSPIKDSVDFKRYANKFNNK